MIYESCVPYILPLLRAFREDDSLLIRDPTKSSLGKNLTNLPNCKKVDISELYPKN